MIKILLAGFLLVGIAFAVYFKWMFSDSLYFDGHSVKYWLLVPELVREAPVFGEGLRYYYSAGDGSWVGGFLRILCVDRDTRCPGLALSRILCRAGWVPDRGW